jgi:autotransporter-associated beta strand protein
VLSHFVAPEARAVTLTWNTGAQSAASWTSSNWSSTGLGLFTDAYTSGADVIFAANATITGATTDVSSITVNDGANVLVTATGTLGTGGSVAALNVGTGSILDLAGQNLSTAAGTGFIKNGAGILFSSNGNSYTGGFTLNSGTVIVGGVNALGSGGVLTLNGGTLAANANRSLTGKYTSIVIGGNFMLGGVTTGVTSGNATAASTLTFDAPVSLGAATRTITLGGTGTYTFGGAISGNAGVGLNLNSASTSSVVLTAANTFSGATGISRGTLTLSGNGTLANTNSITLASGATLALTNTVQLDRLASVPSINSTGGTFSYTNTSGANVYTQSVGAVTHSLGNLNFVEATNQSGTGSQTLTLASLTRSGTATIAFSAAGTGPQASGNKNMFVVTGAGTTSSGAIIGPWATTGTTAALQTDYAVYSGNYVIPANIAVNNDQTTWSTGNNYTFDAATTLTATRTVNSLRYSGSAYWHGSTHDRFWRRQLVRDNWKRGHHCGCADHEQWWCGKLGEIRQRWHFDT